MDHDEDMVDADNQSVVSAIAALLFYPSTTSSALRRCGGGGGFLEINENSSTRA
jgi:hypothetical protein